MHVDIEVDLDEEPTGNREEKITRPDSGDAYHTDAGLVFPISIISDCRVDETDSDDTTNKMLQKFKSSGGQNVGAFRLKDEVGVDVLKGCMYVFDERLETK